MRGRALALTLAIIIGTIGAGCLESPAVDEADPRHPGPGRGAALGSDGPYTGTHSNWTMEPFVAPGGGARSYVLQPRGALDLPEGDGPWPLAVLMHGRHGTCSTPAGETIFVPCTPDTPVVTSVPSYMGYRALTQHLVSHGIAVVSLDANWINDGDLVGLDGIDDSGATARGHLVLHLLDAIRDGQGPWAPHAGAFDLGRIGLMGHSRGGEGVVRAVSLDQARSDPYHLDAVFALAPTDFRRWQIAGPAFATLLPYCDGDVWNLQGAWMYDDNRGAPGAGPMYQFLAWGANHNWYNTIWTGSDWTNRGDDWCDLDSATSARLDAPDQERQGAMVIGAFLRAHLLEDTALQATLAGGEALRPHGIATAYHAPAVARLELADHSAWGSAHGGGTFGGCGEGMCPAPYVGTAQVGRIAWGGLEDGSKNPVTDRSHYSRIHPGFDASDYDFFSIRVALDPGLDPKALETTVVYVGDGQGTLAVSLAEAGHEVPGEGPAAKSVLSHVPVDLHAARQAGIDTTALTEVGIAYGEVETRLLHADWMFWHSPAA